MTNETLLPKTITFPGSGIVCVQDAFEYWRSYMIFPNRERNFTEFMQNKIDSGELTLEKDKTKKKKQSDESSDPERC